MNLLFPRITLRQFGGMFLFGLVGAAIAGIYGIVHDQVTVRLGVEYFTKFKLLQFHYLDPAAPIHFTAVKIGFLATWWVGFFAGWFMARITLPHEPWPQAARRSARGVGLMILTAVLAALIAAAIAPRTLADSRLPGWEDMLTSFAIEDSLAFILVGYIHNASYLGGLIGLITALLWLRLTRPTPSVPPLTTP